MSIPVADPDEERVIFDQLNEEPVIFDDSRDTPPHSPPDNQVNNDSRARPPPRIQTVHRVTALSAFAADALANHLAAHLADIIFFPLEALFVRSLALSFLSSPRPDSTAQAAAARLRGEIFPVGGWFGMGLRGGWRGMGDYVGKMVLVSGMEITISMAIWQACTGFAWMSGRKWFGWGSL